MKPIWTWSAILVIGGLSFLDIRSCKQVSALIESSSKTRDSIVKQNDTLSLRSNALVYQDSILRVVYRRDTAISKKIIDSLSAQIQSARSKIEYYKSQIKITVSDLTNSVSSGDTAAQMKELLNLRSQMSDLADLMHFENEVHDSKDSVYTDQLDYLHVIIAEKDKTIDSLRSIILSKDKLLVDAITQIDTLIDQLKKGKKISIFRTAAEVGLVLLLIFK